MPTTTHDTTTRTPKMVQEIYTRYRNGDGITDDEITVLIESIEAALPFLGASSAFRLVYREAMTDREALQGFQAARKRNT